MAVKYKRNPEAKFNWNVGNRTIESTRKRTLFIYGGLAIMFFGIFALDYITGNTRGWGDEQSGTAQVIKKIVQGVEGEFPAYSLECAVSVVVELPEIGPTTVTLTEVVRTTQDSWNAVHEGDEINVVYRVSKDHTRIHIDQISLGISVGLVE